MNLLYFHLETDFGEDIKLITNNEIDLEQYLLSCGYRNIKFFDINKSYGTCNLDSEYGKEIAKYYKAKL